MKYVLFTVLTITTLVNSGVVFGESRSTFVNILGDRDFFGFGNGVYGVDRVPRVDSFENEPDDPLFTDRDIRRSNPGPNDAVWSHDFRGFIGDDVAILRGTLTFPVAGMQSGVEQLQNRLIVEGIEIPGALDDVNLGIFGTRILTFDLLPEQIDSFRNDYVLNVLLDGGITIFNERDSYYIDFATASLDTLPLELGDYDRNGIVDELDYHLWRSTYGSTVDPFSGADGNSDGVIDAADYTVWRQGFDKLAASSSAFSVPEPSAFWLFSGLLTMMVFNQHRM